MKIDDHRLAPSHNHAKRSRCNTTAAADPFQSRVISERSSPKRLQSALLVAARASLVSYATVDAYDEVEAGSHQRCARPGMKRWFLGVGLDSCFRFSYARSMRNLAKSVAGKEFRLTPSANFLS